MYEQTKKNLENKTRTPEEINRIDKIWQEQVKDKASALQFFRNYYNFLPDANLIGLVDYLDNIVQNGKIPENLLRKRTQQNVWDVNSEIKQQKQEGLQQKAKQMQDQIIEEEDQEQKNALIKKAKKKEKKRLYKLRKRMDKLKVDEYVELSGEEGVDVISSEEEEKNQKLEEDKQ